MATNDLNNKKGFFGRVSSFIKKNIPILSGIKYHPQSLEELKKLVNDPLVKLSQIDVSHVDSFENLFKNSKRTDFSGIEKWDTSHVKNMKKMFYNCKNFNADISKWNVSNVTSMSMMFNGAKSFNQDLSSWDMSGMKGRLNGRFLGNMFRFADKMNKRIFDRYHELESQNVPVEERFNYLPIPKPLDFKKYIVPANFSNDNKEILKLADNFANVDTSATESLDRVLENSSREDFSNFETLDFSNVKTADNFLSNAKHFNEIIPELNNIKYANNMLNGAESFQKDVPQMTNVKQMNGFLDNVDYKGNLHDSMEKASPVSAVKSFDKTSEEHLRNELKNVKSDNAVKLNFIAKTILPYIENGYKKSDFKFRTDFEKFVLREDPNNEYMIFCVSPENIKKIESVCPGLLSIPLKEKVSDNYKDGLLTDSYLVSKSDYKKLLDTNIKLFNPYSEKEDTIENSSLSFSIFDYNRNLGSYTRNLTGGESGDKFFQTFMSQKDDFSLKSNFPMLKAIENSSSFDNVKNKKNMDHYFSTILEKINSISKKNPLAATICVGIIKNSYNKKDDDDIMLKARYLNRYFDGDCSKVKKFLLNVFDDNSSLKNAISSADNKTISDTLSLRECLYDIGSVLTDYSNLVSSLDDIDTKIVKKNPFESNFVCKYHAPSFDVLDAIKTTPYWRDTGAFSNKSKPALLPLLNAMEKISETDQLNTNVDIFDFKDESKLLCKRDLNIQQQKENTTVKKNTNSAIENKKEQSNTFKKSR